MRVSVVIVEDEAPARKKLRDLVRSVDWLDLVGEAEDGPAAVATIDRLEPDLILIDHQLPGHDGVEVVRRIRHRPRVIFTTAHDQHAVTAFELNALDYLLKPFDRDRFLRAVARAHAVVGDDRSSHAERLSAVAARDSEVERLFVRHAGRIVVVAVDRIEHLEARRDYVAVHAPPQRLLIHLPLSRLERRLPSARFVRIHRSVVINVEALSELVPCGNAQLEAVMKSGARLKVSRTHARALRDLAV